MSLQAISEIVEANVKLGPALVTWKVIDSADVPRSAEHGEIGTCKTTKGRITYLSTT